MRYKISSKTPWFFPILKIVFGMDENDSIISLGRTIYTKVDLTYFPHIIAHEVRHLERQRYSLVIGYIFLILFLLSRKFRLREEIEGYKAEWEHILLHIPHHEQYKYLKSIAERLSSPYYGNLVTYGEAVEMICGNKKNILSLKK